MHADALLRQHADLVYRVALRLTGCADDAADVAQEALVRLWQHADRIPEGKHRAWAARVARNSALDHLRRRRVRPERLPSNHPELPSPTPLPDALAEAEAFRAYLDAALDTLGEPYRSLVVLREVEDLSYAEMADALDLPLPTLKVYLHRARRRLREALRALVPDLVP